MMNKGQEMKMFVFEDVLNDYHPGIAMIVAESLERAQLLAYLEFGNADTFEDFLENSGFNEAASEYEVLGVEAGVKHYLYGG